MIRKVFFLLLVCVLFFSASASAADPLGYYLGGAGGIGSPEGMTVGFGNEAIFDRGPTLSLLGGYDFGFWRLEAEWNWRKNDISKVLVFEQRTPSDGSVSANSLLVNGYLEYENSTHFTPWLGAGIGVTDLDFNDLDEAGTISEEEDLYLSLQLLVGASVGFYENFSAHVGYRALWVPEVKFEEPTFDSTSTENYVHQAVTVGLNYFF
ncbi:MAG: hypothetical protein C0616_04075 [Desulfuromonas sp.]|nr:MAG: hypothetical protein C0616_04075 [Desulfuromonas sp.]